MKPASKTTSSDYDKTLGATQKYPMVVPGPGHVDAEQELHESLLQREEESSESDFELKEPKNDLPEPRNGSVKKVGIAQFLEQQSSLKVFILVKDLLHSFFCPAIYLPIEALSVYNLIYFLNITCRSGQAYKEEMSTPTKKSKTFAKPQFGGEHTFEQERQ